MKATGSILRSFIVQWLSVAATSALAINAAPAQAAGCEKDADCKGERVCEEGKCVNPGPAAATPLAPSGPSPAVAPAKQPTSDSPKVAATVVFSNLSDLCTARVVWDGTVIEVTPETQASFPSTLGRHRFQYHSHAGNESKDVWTTLDRDGESFAVGCPNPRSTLLFLGGQAGVNTVNFSVSDDPPADFSLTHNGALAFKFGTIPLGLGVMWELAMGDGGSRSILGGGLVAGMKSTGAEVGVGVDLEGDAVFLMIRYHFMITRSLGITLTTSRSFAQSVYFGQYFETVELLSAGIGLSYGRY